MQTKLRSLSEQVFSTAVGFLASLLTWQFVITPFWHLTTNFMENLNITMVFTVISVARGFFVRRLFNWLDNKNNKQPCHSSESTVPLAPEKTPSANSSPVPATAAFPSHTL